VKRFSPGAQAPGLFIAHMNRVVAAAPRFGARAVDAADDRQHKTAVLPETHRSAMAPTSGPTDSARPRPSRAIWWIAALALAGVVAYAPAISGQVLWDDDAHITKASLQSLRGLVRIWTEVGATQQYYPVLHSAFWIEHRLWGERVVGYHLVTLFLHLASTGLLVACLRKLGMKAAWLAGFLFALHPVMVESVAWISEQKNTLSTALYLGSALAYLNFDSTRRRGQFYLATLLFLAALLTKSVTATLPAALLVVLWWKRGRLELRRDGLPLVPWFAIALPIGLFTSWVERHFIGADGADFALNFLQRSLLAGRVICFYLGKLLWPVNLMFIYPRWTVDAGAALDYLYPLIVVLLLAGAAIAARRNRAPLAALLFFVGTLFPALGFFNVYPFLFSYVADHFQYLASIGVIVLAAGAIEALSQRLFSAKSWAAWVSFALILPLGAATWHQAHLYRDAETLYRTTLRQNPHAWLAAFNLAVIEEHQPGHLDDAIQHYRAALALNPRHWAAHNNLGSALLKQPGQLDPAIGEFEAAIRLRPEFVEAHNNLGIALARKPGGERAALAHLAMALRLQPDYVEARVNLANLLATMPDRLTDAIAEYRVALRYNPRDADAHFGLGNALLRASSDTSAAIDEYRATIRLRPGYARAHHNLAVALARDPTQIAAAIEEYRTALRLDPNDAETHASLGNALLRSPGKLPEAIAEYETAVRLSPDHAALHCSLGIALSDLRDRWPEARRELETATRLKPDFVEAHYAAAVVILRLHGDSNEAAAHLEAALRNNPQFDAARRLLARLRLGRHG
jgi:tetratricopeptide (TPR) repeat protein